MPTSEKQKRTMCAAAHNKSFAKKMGIPQSVGKEMCTQPVHKPSSKKK